MPVIFKCPLAVRFAERFDKNLFPGPQTMRRRPYWNKLRIMTRTGQKHPKAIIYANALAKVKQRRFVLHQQPYVIAKNRRYCFLISKQLITAGPCPAPRKRPMAH